MTSRSTISGPLGKGAPATSCPLTTRPSALRCVAVGRRNWTFCGSDRGGERAAAIYTLVATAKLNDIDPEAWLADVLRRINDHPASRLDELLPWNWRRSSDVAKALTDWSPVKNADRVEGRAQADRIE